MTLYAGELISADNWRFNQDGAYGILAMGPDSQTWAGFADPDTHIAQYSIELGRIKTFTGEYNHFTDADTTAKSNITFGTVNETAYMNSTALMVDADSSFLYSASNFSFGRVYEDDNGTDVSQYFM